MPVCSRWACSAFDNAIRCNCRRRRTRYDSLSRTIGAASFLPSVLASTAYNAGPTRAQQWRGEIPLEGAIYAETIPFDETRHYVKNVMSNTVYYAKLFGQPIESFKKRLGVIAPRDDAHAN